MSLATGAVLGLEPDELTAVATVALAVLTAAYVIATGRLVSHSRTAARTAQRQLVAQLRPLLVDASATGVRVTLGGAEVVVEAEVRNVGGGPARLLGVTVALGELRLAAEVPREILPAGAEIRARATVRRGDADWTATERALQAQTPLGVTVDYSDVGGAERFVCTLTARRQSDATWAIDAVSHTGLPERA